MSTTISHSITPAHTIESNIRKKRSAQHPSNTKSVKSSSTGRWRTRPTRTQIHLSSQERQQALELLNKFGGIKDFSLPEELPSWSPPIKLEDINQDLTLMRDYGSRSPTDFGRSTQSKEERVKPVGSTHTSNHEPSSHVRMESNKTYASTHTQCSQHSPPTSIPPTTTAVPTTATGGSSSASPDTFSSPPDRASRSNMNGRASHVDKRAGAGSIQSEHIETNPLDRSAGSSKGKARCEPDIDWSGWEPQHYVTEEIEALRQRYEQRAKELKRLSDSQRQQISIARENSADPTTLIPEGLEEISDLATIGCVESLLLFTQAFLCFGLNRSFNAGSSNRIEHRQWDSMTGFLSVAKSTARRSGIELTYAICLMYESLLLDRLVEADRPLLLQAYSHETDTEKLLDGFKRIKRILNYQEISKASWTASQTMFEKILGISTPPDKREDPDENKKGYRNPTLPSLGRLIGRMKNRSRSVTPKLLSLDKPYKFSWPIDKSNLDSMADFVVFSSAALDEFLSLNRKKIPYELSKFNDCKILFPNSWCFRFVYVLKTFWRGFHPWFLFLFGIRPQNHGLSPYLLIFLLIWSLPIFTWNLMISGQTCNLQWSSLTLSKAHVIQLCLGHFQSVWTLSGVTTNGIKKTK